MAQGDSPTYHFELSRQTQQFKYHFVGNLLESLNSFKIFEKYFDFAIFHSICEK